MRALAQRTQKSTQEIQKMIEQLQGCAQGAARVMYQGRDAAVQSVEQAAKVKTVLQETAEVVIQINDINHQIAAATRQQGVVTQEANRNLAAVNKGAQESAESVVETAAASTHVAQLAGELKDLVTRFKA